MTTTKPAIWRCPICATVFHSPAAVNEHYPRCYDQRIAPKERRDA